MGDSLELSRVLTLIWAEPSTSQLSEVLEDTAIEHLLGAEMCHIVPVSDLHTT